MARTPNTVFIVVSKDVIRRNILDTAFWPTLRKENPDTTFVLFTEPGRADYYRERFGGEGVVIEEYERERSRGFASLILFLMRSGIRSKSTTFHRWHAYARKRAGFLPTLGKELLSLLFGRLMGYKQLLRALLATTRAPSTVQRFFDTYQPGLVFVPSLLDADFDVVFGLEARRRKIPVVGMVRSWDNLNHHGLLAFVPDRFIFQNRWLLEAAQTFQGINTKKLKKDVVGLPHYDLYKDPTPFIKNKEEFFESMGLDPAKRLILVGGAEYYYSEDVLPHRLEEAITQGFIAEPVQILFRPHPASMYTKEEYHLEGLTHVVLDSGSSRSFSDTEAFINTLSYADVVINICSTLSIDAAAFGKPSIAIGYEEPKKNIPYWQSVERLNDFDHQARLLKTRGTRVATSFEKLVADINAYLADPSLDAKERETIIEEFAAPFDGKAGERLGRLLTEECRIT